ncbi:MAG: hypothetical protein MJ114_07520 [Acetatifactor sp.]|nr:hypothetical protein [Acetatifactor sp.]
MNLSNLARNASMLRGRLSRKGYMRWWHSFSGINEETGTTRTFYIEFLIVNPALGGDQPIFGQHPYYKKRGMKPSYVSVNAGMFPTAEGNDGVALKNYYPISALKTTPSPLVMQVEDCFYSEEKLVGSVQVTPEEADAKYLMTDAGSMEWNLEVHKAVSCDSGYLSGLLMQALNALDSYWHGEGVKSFFRGHVTVNGETYLVIPEISYGYADKHWGQKFNRPWLQFNCSKLFSERTGQELRHSVLSVNGCCPRFLFLPLRRKLLIQLTYTGEDFDYGFKPFVLSRCQWETKVTNRRYIWHILAQNKDSVIKISGSCTKEQMMHMKYEDPDGLRSKLPLLAGSGAVGTIQIYRRSKEGKILLDTLHMSQGFCEYRPAPPSEK